MTEPRPTRRHVLDRLTKGAVAIGVVGAGAALMHSCGPDAATLAAQNALILRPPQTGAITFIFEDHPILVKRLSPSEKAALYGLDDDDLEFPKLNRHWRTQDSPAATADNTLYGPDKTLLVLSLRCTYRGCVTLEDSGDWDESGGYFCPCCATHYDGLGRKRKAIGQNNLLSPDLEWVGDGTYRLTPLPANWNQTR